MNQFLGDRFQDINDAIVSAPSDSLLEIEQELSATLAQVRKRLAAGKSAKPSPANVITHLSGHLEGLTGR